MTIRTTLGLCLALLGVTLGVTWAQTTAAPPANQAATAKATVAAKRFTLAPDKAQLLAKKQQMWQKAMTGRTPGPQARWGMHKGQQLEKARAVRAGKDAPASK